jgi:hypothetical protein
MKERFYLNPTRFYPKQAHLFSEVIDGTINVEERISMAALQGIFLLNKDDGNKALLDLKEYLVKKEAQLAVNGPHHEVAN